MVLVRWGIALVEYRLQAPVKRSSDNVPPVGQLNILQGVITLAVFVPFAVFFLKEKPTWDYLWAGFCLLGAVYFMIGARLA